MPATMFEQVEPLEAECKTMSDIINLLNDTLDCEGNCPPPLTSRIERTKQQGSLERLIYLFYATSFS